MAVRLVDDFSINVPEKYVGLSTDTKPSYPDARAGSQFWELDAKKNYIYDGISTWYATT